MRRVSCTVRSSFPGSSAKPGARTCVSHGITIWAAMTSTSSVHSRTVRTSSANDLAAARPSRSSTPAKSGTKAALNAPSANSRRRKFGSLKADEEGVRHRPCPQDRGDQDVAQETEHARAHGVAADGCGPAGECHGLRGGRRGAGGSAGRAAARHGIVRAPAGRDTGLAPEHLGQAALHLRDLGIAGELQAEAVPDVEDIDGAGADRRDVRRADRDAAGR